MNTILLTGYDKWHETKYNSSWEMLESADIKLPEHWKFELEKLPVSWEKAPETLATRIHEDVKAIVCFGMGGREKICCERIALNLISPTSGDVNSKKHDSEFVVRGAPAAYWTQLPFRQICSAVQNQGIPCGESHNAGLYLCNYIFYWLLNYITEKELDIIGGFIHVPPFEDLGGIEQTKLSQAANIIANTVVDFVDGQSILAT